MLITINDVFKNCYTAEFGRTKGSKNGMRRPTLGGHTLKGALIGGGLSALGGGAVGIARGLAAEKMALAGAGRPVGLGERMQTNGVGILRGGLENAARSAVTGGILGAGAGAATYGGKKAVRRLRGKR